MGILQIKRTFSVAKKNERTGTNYSKLVFFASVTSIKLKNASKGILVFPTHSLTRINENNITNKYLGLTLLTFVSQYRRIKRVPLKEKERDLHRHAERFLQVMNYNGILILTLQV